MIEAMPNRSQQLIPQETDTGQEELQRERKERVEARRQRRKLRRRTQLLLWGAIGSSIVLLGLMGFIFLQIQSIIAFNALHPPINGVSCDSREQNAYHIHIHLTIYLNGNPTPIPAGIGIPSDGTCFYWMHTHTSDGIIHIEDPAKLHNLALDDFLAIWRDGFAKLNFPPQINQHTGWKIYVNGKPFAGVVTSPLNTEVPLASHDLVTLEYGTPNPPPDTIFVFPPGLPK